MTTADAVADHVAQLVLFCGGPPDYGDNQKIGLARAARFLGISYRKAKALRYREVRNIPAHEYLAIVHRAQQLEQRLATRKAERDAYMAALARAGVPADLGMAGRSERAVLPAGQEGPAGDATGSAAEPLRRLTD